MLRRSSTPERKNTRIARALFAASLDRAAGPIAASEWLDCNCDRARRERADSRQHPMIAE
jgi:hypothetical protein